MVEGERRGGRGGHGLVPFDPVTRVGPAGGLRPFGKVQYKGEITSDSTWRCGAKGSGKGKGRGQHYRVAQGRGVGPVQWLGRGGGVNASGPAHNGWSGSDWRVRHQSDLYGAYAGDMRQVRYDLDDWNGTFGASMGACSGYLGMATTRISW